MSVSIIIPAYNAEETIIRCLNSIENQESQELISEVIVVNDGSRDNTEEIVKEYAIRYPKIKLVTQENSGVSRARNQGILMAKGEYIVFCDSDDEIAVNGCMTLYQAIKKNDCDMVICGYEEKHQDTSIIRTPSTKKMGSIYSIGECYDELFYGYFLNTPWGRIIKREKILKLFDEKLQNGEDIKFVLDYLESNPRCKTINEVLYIVHAEGLDSLSRNRIHALKGTVETQLSIGRFISDNNIKANWMLFSDYCISLIWSNIVDGVKLDQFSYESGYNAIQFSMEYYVFVKTLYPQKSVNKVMKMLLLTKNRFLILSFLRIVSLLKRVK